jgi:hypothetical protein
MKIIMCFICTCENRIIKSLSCFKKREQRIKKINREGNIDQSTLNTCMEPFIWLIYTNKKEKVKQLSFIFFFHVLKHSSRCLFLSFLSYFFQNFLLTISISAWILLYKKVSFSDFSSLSHVINGASLGYGITAAQIQRHGTCCTLLLF